MKRLLIAATLLSVAAAPAAARASTSHTNTVLRHKVIRLYGHRAPGCDLVARKCQQHPHPSRALVHRYFGVLRRMITPPRAARLLTASRPYVTPARSATIRATGAPLAAIRHCESGGNYSTDTGNGFHGAYQFTQSTWESVGGTGNPAAASPAEQDKRAAILYARRGAQPWPVCGR